MIRMISAMLAAAILVGPRVAAAAGDAQAGSLLYSKSCATCHGDDGTPKAAIAKMMKVEMRHLGSPEVQALSDKEHREAILEGIGKMKPVKGLSEAEVHHIVAFVRTLKQK